MKKPILFYQEELARYEADTHKLKSQLVQLSLVRLAIFLLTSLGVYLVYPNELYCLGIIVLGIAVFLFLMKKHANLKEEKNLTEALAQLNAEEIAIANGDFHNRNTGELFQNPKHYYSLDIDLFGRASFFQYMNRTETEEGTGALANVLLANEITSISSRQETIKELAALPKWRQLFAATARLIKIQTPGASIIDWLNNYQSFIPKFMQWFPMIFSGLSIGVIALFVLDYIPEFAVLVWLFIGLGITGYFKKKTDLLSQNIDRVKDTFQQYANLLEQIENQTFHGKLLQEQKELIQAEGKKASTIFKELTKIIKDFDNRKNILSAVISNGFMLWDIKQTYKLEQWIAQYNNKIEDWLKAVSFFDAYNSLGNYAFNKPEYIYPSINTNHTTIDTKSLGHPLLFSDNRVDNDLKINNQEFFIITGANMAGKSTFLRTISLHIVMANVGLPICAARSEYTPVKLITSMRTVDSLTDDSSYFFAELTRLKFIINEIKKEPYFIILDEILKGTNSTDKAIGSKKFVEKLVASKATGIIATHDLSLCEIEKVLDEVKNYYFDAEIIDDELHFDYTFKKGICKNMNASFLLKKMEIV